MAIVALEVPIMAKPLQTKRIDQPDTPINSNIIPAHQHLATVMRYEGFTFDEVTETINGNYGLKIPKATIIDWFTHGRPLRDYYDSYAQAQNELRETQAENVFKSRLDEAVRVLALGLAGKATKEQIFAAKEWLDRAIGRTIERRINKNMNVHASLADVIAEADAKLELENKDDNNQNSYEY